MSQQTLGYFLARNNPKPRAFFLLRACLLNSSTFEAGSMGLKRGPVARSGPKWPPKPSFLPLKRGRWCFLLKSPWSFLYLNSMKIWQMVPHQECCKGQVLPAPLCDSWDSNTGELPDPVVFWVMHGQGSHFLWLHTSGWHQTLHCIRDCVQGRFSWGRAGFGVQGLSQVLKKIMDQIFEGFVSKLHPNLTPMILSQNSLLNQNMQKKRGKIPCLDCDKFSFWS